MRFSMFKLPMAIIAFLTGVGVAYGGVSPGEAAKLKSELTPVGAIRAGNSDGTIPEWTGGLTTVSSSFVNGGRRTDPFAEEKPILEITAANMNQHAEKLTDGVKALLKKYPDTYRLDVYETHRTAAAPQWLYENTFNNATDASLKDVNGEPVPEGALGGYPFPIPKSGAEVMLNAKLRWRGESWYKEANNYNVTSDGRAVLLSSISQDNLSPYYAQDISAEEFDGIYWAIRLDTHAPSLRVGEAILGHLALNENNSKAWTYLPGQRRVRMVPNACCDTPTPAAAGLMSFDEVEVFSTTMGRFDWEIVEKKEVYIPYNSNRTMVPTKDSDVLGEKHLNPDHIRWELHRVWVVEATVKEGQRHTSPRTRYYVDEDSWLPVLADRWDAKGQLWRTLYSIPVAMPDLPGQVPMGWGGYNLLTESYVAMELVNEYDLQYKIVSPNYDFSFFAPARMSSGGVR